MKRKILILAFIFWGIGCFVGGYLVKANAAESTVKLDVTYFQYNKIVATGLKIMCDEGYIFIPFNTGIVEFHNCTTNEATKKLFEGLKPYFDSYKKEICKDDNEKAMWTVGDMWSNNSDDSIAIFTFVINNAKLEHKDVELGFRGDGVVVWRYTK